MKKLLLLIMLLICVTLTASVSETIDVKDYIKGKFPVIFNIYLSSLGELDEYEKEFIDLLQNLPKEEQENFAKEVYDNGFSKEILEEMKAKDIITKTETEIEEKDVEKTPFAQDREFEHDFRATNWGMSEKQVRATEEEKPVWKGGTPPKRTIAYEAKIGGKLYYACYHFLEDKLWRSKYLLMVENKNKYDYIRDYEDIKEILIKKYGEPDNNLLAASNKDEIQQKDGLYKDYKEIKEILIKKYGESDNDILAASNKDEMYWKDDLYKDDKSKWGLAISVGDLEYLSAWETSTTQIFLSLVGGNYEISLSVWYTSKELKEWASKISEEETKSEL